MPRVDIQKENGFDKMITNMGFGFVLWQGELKSIFPVENRLLGADGSHLRKQLDQFKSRPFYERIADFHVLLFLSRFLDPNTDIPQLADAVRTHGDVSDGYQIIIESL